MRKIIWISIVSLELIILGFVGFGIYKNRYAASVAFIPKESLVFSNDGELNYFYELKPLYQGEIYQPEWLGYKPELNYNADGFNDRFDYTPEKPPGTFRIITLGDSWTYGQFVHTRDSYPELLEDLLNQKLSCNQYKKFEVINLGVPSYDIEYSVERFKRRGEKYNPDLILWLITINDFEEILEYVKPRSWFYQNQTKELEEEHGGKSLNPFSKPPTDLALNSWKLAVEDLWAEYGKDKILQYHEDKLRLLDDYYKNTLVLLTSSFFNYKDEFLAVLKRVAGSRENTFFLQSTINFTNDMLLLPDYHPNKKGYSLMVQEIFDYLLQNKIISCE